MSPSTWSRIGRLLPADAALNLAVFRIVVALLFLTTREVWSATAWASLPPSLAIAPRGWGWALALLPPNAIAARVASIAVIAAASLGAIGVFARVAFAVLVVAALYLLALPLRSGMPYHYQHLVWFAAICAASPCADALALNGWRRRRAQPPPPRSPAYGVPLRAAWLLVGVIFFFPGLCKLRALGMGWITSDNLRNQMYWKWASTPGFAPLFRIDRFPALLHAGAAAVVALELSFVFAIWTRWSRRVAIAGALAFHACARWFMGIDFSGLWLTYVMFVDWDGLARRWLWRRDTPAPPVPMSIARIAPALIMGAVLVVGAVDAGARGATLGWPFACYPTFQDRAETRIPALAIGLVRGGGELPLDPTDGVARADAAREWIFGARLLASARAPDAGARFAAYWQRLSARTHASERWPDLNAVRFYAATTSTVPEERALPPRPGALVYELTLERPSTMMPRARSGAITSSSSDAAASVK